MFDNMFENVGQPHGKPMVFKYFINIEFDKIVDKIFYQFYVNNPPGKTTEEEQQKHIAGQKTILLLLLLLLLRLALLLLIMLLQLMLLLLILLPCICMVKFPKKLNFS